MFNQEDDHSFCNSMEVLQRRVQVKANAGEVEVGRCLPVTIGCFFRSWTWGDSDFCDVYCSLGVVAFRSRRPFIRPCLDPGCKLFGCYIWCYVGVSYVGIRILIKNKLQNPLVNHEMNLLNLINPSLAHICSTLLSNHELIRLKRFVSQSSRNLCN